MRIRKDTKPKELFERLYVQEKKTQKECGEVLGISVSMVCLYLKKYGIPARPRNTEEIGRKISKAKKGKPSTFKGHKLSDEAKARISQANKRRYKSPSVYGGHKKKRGDGYIIVYCPDHPFASKDGHVLEHKLVMEQAIGRYLVKGEVVHHKNHIRDDNRLENLELMTHREHARLHLLERRANKKKSEVNNNA